MYQHYSKYVYSEHSKSLRVLNTNNDHATCLHRNSSSTASQHSTKTQNQPEPETNAALCVHPHSARSMINDWSERVTTSMPAALTKVYTSSHKKRNTSNVLEAHASITSSKILPHPPSPSNPSSPFSPFHSKFFKVCYHSTKRPRTEKKKRRREQVTTSHACYEFC